MSAFTNLFNKVIRNPLLLQSLLSLIARFTGVALNFAVILLITNQLSKSGAGDLMLLMTFITGVALISRLGIDQLLMKEVASSHQDNLSFKNDFLKVSYKAVFALSLIFMTVWVIATPYLQRSFFHNGIQSTVSINELIVASLGILSFNLVILNSTYLKAIRKTMLGVLGQNALTAITFLFLILAFWNYFTNNQYTLYLYTASIVMAGLLSALFTYSFTSKQKILISRSSNNFNDVIPGLKQVLKKSIPLAPISIISYLMIFTDSIMVGWFLPNEQVAEYSVASRISYVILFFLQAMEATIYPRLLNMFKHAKATLRAFFWQSTALVVMVVLSVTGIMYLLSDWILLAFGNEYTVARHALGLLLLAQLFRAASITFSFMFIIREKVKYLNMILVTAFVVNVICNLVFIQLYGIEGAALATLIANLTLLVLVLTLFYLQKLLISPANDNKPARINIKDTQA
ncbi:MAG: oligosaccharide flippase family protein [Cocleimonas sp.]